MDFKMFLNIYLILFIPYAVSFRCDRRPHGSSTLPTEADGRFELSIPDIENNAYIPEQLYTVQITATDEMSTFTSFMISAEGETKTDPRNPRRVIYLDPGELRPISSSTSKYSDRCLNSIEETMNSMKTSVEVYWQAPPSGNGCVSLRAMVAENEDVWFTDGAPLSLKLCEDMRQPDDVAPQVNMACGICDEAKYEISFTGLWSRNTHPYMYPENEWLPKYSDLVGASHGSEYVLWSPGNLATDGLRDLAEHANTSKLEVEIREAVGKGSRTLIKGKGHGYPRMGVTTYAFFRVDQVNHLFSAAVGISPSPDWFLGVTRFELCQEDNTWLPERELNLYPWDAGTDSGVSYESANIQTFPQDAISRVDMSTHDTNSPFFEMDIKTMHPFGKLGIKLIRTYHKECVATTEAPTEVEDGGESPDENPEKTDSSEDVLEPSNPSRYQTQLDSGDDGRFSDEEVVEVTEPTPAPKENCPMSKWNDWSPCEGECVDGKLIGYRWKERYHLVNGVAVEKYDPYARRAQTKQVSKYCKANFETFKREACEEESCDENNDEDNLTADRRIMVPIQPGAAWNKRRAIRLRDVYKTNK